MATFKPEDHMISLKGKDYLQVMWRLVWFRQEHPDWKIETELLDHDQQTSSAIFRATIYDTEGNALQTGYGSETIKDFHDYIEKAETKAVGRALAMLGYGTQFAPEFDEEERVADSPVQRAAAPSGGKGTKTQAASGRSKCQKCGMVIVPYTGKNGKTVDPDKHIASSMKKFGSIMCIDCINKLLEEEVTPF